MREPTLLPVFGKLGAKPPVAVAATPKSKSMEKAAARMRVAFSSHGALAFKLCVVLWTIAVLAAVYFSTKA